jgi:hypothetical protein
MNLYQHLKRIMRRLTPGEMAAAELADAELHRLEAHTAMEYASSVVGYENVRIKRLRNFLSESEQT